MIYAMSDFVQYVRRKDARLADKTRYPDVVVEDWVVEGFATAQDIRPVFTTKELYDLTDTFVTDGLTEIEIIPTREVHTLHAFEKYDDNVFELEITANNHVIVRKKEGSGIPKTYELEIRYFYYPLLPIDEIELSVDSYRLIKEAIAAVAYAAVMDHPLEQYHLDRAKRMAVDSTYDLEKKVLEVPDTRFWSGTWV